MPEIDPDDLIDAADIAAILDLSSARAVSVYRARYSDFPAPFVSKASGKCVLWLRADVERWKASRGPAVRRPED